MFSCAHTVKILSTPFFLQNTSGGCFFISLMLHVAQVILRVSNFDFVSWKKYYFDFLADVFFSLLFPWLFSNNNKIKMVK